MKDGFSETTIGNTRNAERTRGKRYRDSARQQYPGNTRNAERTRGKRYRYSSTLLEGREAEEDGRHKGKQRWGPLGTRHARPFLCCPEATLPSSPPLPLFCPAERPCATGGWAAWGAPVRTKAHWMFLGVIYSAFAAGRQYEQLSTRVFAYS